MKYDLRLLTMAADNFLKTATNPKQRRIISNYRRHAMLEVSGRYEEIFVPEMTIEEPSYKVISPGGMRQLDGEAAVKKFYRSLLKAQTTVMMLEHERLVVDDSGFASEALYHTYMSAESARRLGHRVPDMDANYLESRWVCMLWPYDKDGRMIGEHVYPEPATTLKICADEDFVSLEDARGLFEPIIDACPVSEFA